MALRFFSSVSFFLFLFPFFSFLFLFFFFPLPYFFPAFHTVLYSPFPPYCQFPVIYFVSVEPQKENLVHLIQAQVSCIFRFRLLHLFYDSRVSTQRETFSSDQRLWHKQDPPTPAQLGLLSLYIYPHTHTLKNTHAHVWVYIYIYIYSSHYFYLPTYLSNT